MTEERFEVRKLPGERLRPATRSRDRGVPEQEPGELERQAEDHQDDAEHHVAHRDRRRSGAEHPEAGEQQDRRAHPRHAR